VRDASFSPGLKWLIAVILPLTLAWKLTVAADTNDHLEHDIIVFLTRQGFHAVATEDMSTEDVNLPGIQAVSGACQIRVMRVSYDGANRDMVRNLVAANDRLIFIHRGKAYREQPVLLTVLDQIWTRSLRKMGLADHDPPVLAVVAPAQCDAEKLPWEQL
jgi:hypothetical protein